MAGVDPADVQLPPHALVHRQRFYFLRHGQSVNNFYSLQDEAGETFEEARPQEQQLPRQQQQHLLCQREGEKQQQQEQRQRPPYSVDCCSQQLDQQTVQQERLHQSTHTDEQRHQELPLQSARQKHEQRPLHQGQEREGQLRPQRQKGMSLQPEGEVPPARGSLKGQRSRRPTRRVSDPSLTEVGRRQAAAAARWVQRHVQQMLLRSHTGRKRRQQLMEQAGEDMPSPAIKKIVCSPMRRALETAAELRKVLTVDVYVHPLLFEQGGLFSGPRKIPSSTATVAASVATAAARDEGGVLRGASCESKDSERASDGSSRISSTGGVTDVLPEVGDDGSMESWKPMAAPEAEACNRHSSGACEGLTLQEVKSLLPGVKIIIPSRGCRSWKQPLGARRDDSDKEAAFAAAGCSKALTSCMSAGKGKVAPGTTDTSRTPQTGARLTGTDDSGLVVQRVHEGEAAAKAEAVGGHYCEEWTRGGRSWWCGGREKLIDTVARAAEIVSWMQSECRVAQDTGGSVLMVMHGLMMDLIVKALMFPFPSASSACPYLDLLAQSLRAHEVASGKPFYNMPQQTAYFTSSNCSFCCFELAAAAQQQPVYLSGPPSRPACVYYGFPAPTHVRGCEADGMSTVANGGGTSGSGSGTASTSPCGMSTVANGGATAGSGSGTASLLVCEDQLRKRQLRHEQEDPSGDSVGYSGRARLDMSATDVAEACRWAEGTNGGAAGDTVGRTDYIRVLPTVVEIDAPHIVMESSKETAGGGVGECGGSGGAAEARASAVRTTASDGAVSLTSHANTAPALVSALIEWNVPAVGPQLYSGQTLGSSIIMSC